MFKDKILGILKNDKYKPKDLNNLIKMIKLKRKDRYQFIKSVNELVEKGKIIKLRRGQLVIPDKHGVIVGELEVNKRGFGFVSRGEDKSDIFIPEVSMKDAMNGDTVEVKIIKKDVDDKKAEGKIENVIKRKTNKFVGVYQKSRNFGFVVPEDMRVTNDIYINNKNSNYAEDGDVVVAEIIRWPQKGRNADGIITEILGKKGDKGVDILTVVKKYDLPEEFPREVLQYANNIKSEISSNDLKGRVDLTSKDIITIDGVDAKDLDDAVSVEKLKNGNYLLGVHIADVTHYVKENDPIDKEAFERSTSVYLLDLVIPMLPQKLSNDLCSLNPFEHKLSMTCEMEINSKGHVVNHKIFESVIESKLRANYKDITNVLEDKDFKDKEKYAPYKDMINYMKDLQEILEKKRHDRGAMEFEIPESKIKLNKLGKPISVEKEEREISNKIIEEFMLAANETVSEHMTKLKVPFIYRVHENPDEEKLKKFSEFSFNLGYPVSRGKDNDVKAKALQDIMEKVKGKKEEVILSKLLLRSMMRAKYSPENKGHFGLAAEYYSHFTSPIRRYPDLEIHRIIKEELRFGIGDKRERYLNEFVEEASKRASENERHAEEAERELDSLKKAEYMAEKIGEKFEGIIGSITNFGMFIELENTIEGLVHISDMDDDYYVYDDIKMDLTGENNEKVYSLGDKIKIIVSKVDLDTREIFFEIDN